jgi:hypothetical protein
MLLWSAAWPRDGGPHGVGAADGPGAGLGHAEVPDLARCDEFGDGASDVLSRHVRVHPVLLVQVNYVRADAAQPPVGRLRDVLGPLTRSAWRPWPSNRWLVHVLVGFGAKQGIRLL